MPTMPDDPPAGRPTTVGRMTDGSAESLAGAHPADHRLSRPEPLVTISASCGAGGSVIGPQLAERLGLPFIDRAFSSAVRAGAAAARRADVRSADEAPTAAPAPPGSTPARRSSERLTKDEEAVTPSNRFFAYLARAAGVGGMLSPDVMVDEHYTIRNQAEADLVGLAKGDGGVLLGRAGAIVLAQRPRAYHVRLDGPESRRIQRAAELEHIDVAQAAEHLAEADRARTLYVRRLYRADPTEDRWYHLRLDTTVLPLDRCVDVLLTAVNGFLDQH